MIVDHEPMTMTDLAVHFGVSRRRIKQLLDRAHDKLRAALGADGGDMLRVLDLARRQTAMPHRRRGAKRTIRR